MKTQLDSLEQKDTTPIRWFNTILLAVVVASAISMAGLSFRAAIINAESSFDYEFKDNDLAEKREGLNKWLILGYTTLAVVGAIGFAMGETSKLSFFKFWMLFPLAFWVWCGLSFFWSDVPSLSIRRIAHLYMAISGAYGVAALLNRREMIWAAILSMFMLTFSGILAELALGTFRPWNSGYRFCGLGHPNETSLFAAVLAIAARIASIMEYPESKLKGVFTLRRIAFALLIFAIGIVLITKSRTTAGSLLVAFLIMQLAMSSIERSALLLTSLMSCAAIVGLFLATVTTSTSNSVFGVASIGRTSHVATLTGRLPLWEEIFKSIEKKPLFGFGYGAYWTTERVEDFAQIFYWEPPNGHSIYVDSLVEIGAFGFFIFVMALLATFVTSLYTFFSDNDNSQVFAIGLTSMAIIHGLTESSFLKGCMGPLWLSLAIFTLLRARSERDVRFIPALAPMPFERKLTRRPPTARFEQA